MSTRKAGEKLDEPTKASQDAKEALSRSERHKLARERIGNDPDRLAERISIVDRDKFDVTGYTDKEINMALQGSTFSENDYARLTGEGGSPDKPESPTPDPEPTPPPSSPKPAPPEDEGLVPLPPIVGNPIAPGSGGQTQIVSQDNDQTSTVSGDGNTINQSQDNSITQSSGNSYLADWMKSHNFF